MKTHSDKIEFLPNGQAIIIGDTHLSAWAKEHGNIITDPHLFIFLKPHLEDVQCIWDIGANIGDHTRAYLDMGKNVCAFEPNPCAYECLIHNCPESNNYNVAAGSRKGNLNFDILDNVGASKISNQGEIAVEVMPLDSMKLPKPDFVKIDIEGWEFEALKGMKKTLKKHRPKLFIEINNGALNCNNVTHCDILRFLNDLGYSNVTTYPIGSSLSDPQLDILVLP